MAYPDGAPVLPDRFRGRPVIAGAACAAGLPRLRRRLPHRRHRAAQTGALTLDMGRCLFCADCAAACPEEALHFTREHRLAAWAREDLVLRRPAAGRRRRRPIPAGCALFRRSLKLRQVCAGGCNACEADINVLSTVAFDLGRFGIQFVASPRHADGLLITGPVTENMKLALEKTYQAVPPPRVVIAVGACAISGGPTSTTPRRTTAPPASSPWTSSSPAARPTP